MEDEDQDEIDRQLAYEMQVMAEDEWWHKYLHDMDNWYLEEQDDGMATD